MNKEQVIEKLNESRDILHGFRVKALYLFGSAVRGEAKETSDIDLLVEFEDSAHIGLFEFARLQRMLSERLGCEVDLATPDALHKALKGRIMKEAIRAA
jgi:predicted nucleotidyltransferase